MIPKDYSARKGDVLIVHAVVKRDQHPDDDYVSTEIEGHYGSFLLNPESIKDIAWLGIEPGEEVYCGLEDIRGTVVAIDNGQAWVRATGGYINTVIPVSQLERVQINLVAEAAE